MKSAGRLLFILSLAITIIAGMTVPGCRIYKFNQATVPDSINSVKVNFIENRARYINPQLSPQLTDRLRQKIVSQTRLSQTNEETADWEISGEIREYNVTTSGIANQQEATNRLTVSVHIVLNDRKADKTSEYDVSRNIEFRASLSLQQAESQSGEELIRGLVDDIFNRIFSNW